MKAKRLRTRRTKAARVRKPSVATPKQTSPNGFVMSA
jgi:hypothetical protein